MHTWWHAETIFLIGSEASIQTIESVYHVGDEFKAVAPNKYDYIANPSDGLQAYFIVEPALPQGLLLSPSDGGISGTLLAPSMSTDYMVFLIDPLTELSKHVWTIKNLEVLVPPVSKATMLSPAAYTVPVGFVLLVLLLWYLYIRNDSKKEYHIFISYRGWALALISSLS
jgi:hypothetical protein